MIVLENLTKKFGLVTAVDDLSLRVDEGELFGLIGPDGAGKTTTLRVIATAMTPTTGRATVAGFDTVRQPEAIKALLGYMPQRFALYPDLAVRENLDFFADVFGARGADRQERIARLLGFARLTEFQTRRAAHLSGGMQKKLALASTLVHHPRLLLLDEPTTGVDPVSRREFWDLLSQVHLEGVTIVVSTPYLDEAERCSRVGLMHRGRLVACDAPDRLRAAVPGTVIELQSSTPGAARHVAEACPGVLDVSAHGESLRILVDEVGKRRPQLQARWDEAGVTVQNLRQVKPRLEEAFITLVKQQRNEGK